LNEIDEIFDKFFNFFGVSTITDLSKKLEMSQPAVTNWQRRNSISAIKKKCRELGIYSEIFGDLNSSINNQTIRDNHGNLSQTGNVHTLNQKDDNNVNIDEAVFAMFKRAYSKCLDDDNELIEDKIDELIAHLMKFK